VTAITFWRFPNRPDRSPVVAGTQGNPTAGQ